MRLRRGWHATHLNAEKSKLQAGFEAVHVPFKGTPEALSDVIGGATTGSSRRCRRRCRGRGLIHVATSTVSPQASAQAAALEASAGIEPMRCTVSGNNKMAEAAELTVMASGPRAAFDRMEPLLRGFGPNLFPLGDAEQARLMIRALGQALPAIRKAPQDLKGRSDALYGAWLCGSVLAGVEMALHHKLCHTLGGTFNLPHAETHTIVLPHALAYNAPAASDAVARVGRALGGASGPQAVYDLVRDNGAPVALRDIGMKESDLDQACDIAMSNQYPNPRPLERGALRQLLQDAFEGVRPAV